MEFANIRTREDAEHLGNERLRELRQKMLARFAEIRNASRPVIKSSQFTDYEIQKFRAASVWDNVLDYLTDKKDVLAAYNTCNMFQSSLETKRVQVLFPEVAEILVQNEDIEMEENDNLTRDFKNLRASTKEVKKSMDKIMTQSDLGNDDWWTQFDYDQIPTNIMCCIGSMNDVDRMIARCRANSFDSIFFRYVEVFDDVPEERKTEFRLKISELLQLVGGQVWSFIYQTGEQDPAEYYRWAVEWAGLMPELNALQLMNTNDEFDQDEEDGENGGEDAEVDHEENFVQGRQNENLEPPVLLNLRILSFFGACSTEMVVSMIRSNPQIRKLAVPNMGGKLAELGPVVQNLQLNSIWSNDFNFEVMAPWMMQFHWPLKQICFKNDHDLIIVDQEPLFQLLEHFQDTLEDVNLTNVYFGEIANRRFLNLPKLTDIAFRLLRDEENADFLLPCKNLSSIIAHIIEDNGLGHPTDIVQLRGIVGRLDQSNVWVIFPRLEYLRIDRVDSDIQHEIKRKEKRYLETFGV